MRIVGVVKSGSAGTPHGTVKNVETLREVIRCWRRSLRWPYSSGNGSPLPHETRELLEIKFNNPD
jgi:hypothetical protein